MTGDGNRLGEGRDRANHNGIVCVTLVSGLHSHFPNCDVDAMKIAGWNQSNRLFSNCFSLWSTIFAILNEAPKGPDITLRYRVWELGGWVIKESEEAVGESQRVHTNS